MESEGREGAEKEEEYVLEDDGLLGEEEEVTITGGVGGVGGLLFDSGPG